MKMARLKLDDLSKEERKILDRILRALRENPGALEHQLRAVFSDVDGRILTTLIDVACSSGLIEKTRSGRMFAA